MATHIEKLKAKDGRERGEHVVCETWGDLLSFVQGPRDKCLYRSSQNKSTNRDDWTMTKDFPSAIKLATDGWRKGTDAVNRISQRLEAKLIHKIVREDVNYDVEGMGFDVSRYLSGEPEHWVQQVESDLAENSHRHVRVVCNVAVSCGISTQVIQARGAAMAALIEMLEYAGHRVELWVCASGSDKYSPNSHADAVIVASVKVKAYDQPIDPARLAFALCHPSMFRRVFFSAWEHTSPATQKLMGSCYSYPCDYDLHDGAIYVGKALLGEVQWTSPEGAEAWILGQLAAQGVVIRED